MWLALGFVSGYLVIFYAAGKTKEMLLLTNVFLMNLMTLIGVIVYVLIWICLVYFAKARRKGLNAINKQFLLALLRYWTLSKVLSTLYRLPLI